jgi:Haem-binding uptake, Tiki superfamily, ChaN
MIGLDELGRKWPQLRSLLPVAIDTSNAEHRRHFMIAMGFDGSNHPAPLAHSAGGESSERINRWYESQCVWDEYFAESLANVVMSGENRVVALVGSGHVETRSAVPDRIQKLCKVRPFSIVTRPVGWTSVGGVSYPDIPAFERGSDLVWYTSRTQDIV